MVESTNLIARQPQEIIDTLSMLIELVCFEHSWALQRAWIELVVLHRTASGVDDAARNGKRRRALGSA